MRRAIVIGIICALGIAAYGYIHGNVFRLSNLVGNHFPASVFGALVVVVLVVNPLLARVRPQWRLRPKELAVIVALVLVTCGIPGAALGAYFPPAVTVPIQMNRTNVGWRARDTLSYLPEDALFNDGRYEEVALAQVYNGLGEEPGPVEPDEVPWSRWAGTLGVWLPLAALLGVATILLSLVIYRQWAHRERLRFPIASFANAIMEQQPGRALPSIFRSRGLWIGLAVVLGIRLVNGVNLWMDGAFIEIPLVYDFAQVGRKWPDLTSSLSGQLLFTPRLFPTVMAFAYFLASDVSLSLGLTQPLYVFLEMILLAAGVDFASDYVTGGGVRSQLAGSWLAMGLVTVYLGRSYYANVARQAVTFRPRPGVRGYEAWALRLFLLVTVALCLLLVRLGLDWPLAVAMVLLMLTVFLVMARINAESGLFFIQPFIHPAAVFLGALGAFGVGPHALAIIAMASLILIFDPRAALMPFVTNGLRMCDSVKASVARVGFGAAPLYAAGVVLAVGVAVWATYSYGLPHHGWWTTDASPKLTINAVDSTVSDLERRGRLNESVQLSAWERLTRAEPDRRFLWWAGIGLAAVLGLTVLRLRLPRWPLHPILLLAWGTFPMWMMSHSFLLGWLVKTLVTKFGGQKAYRSGRAIMIGVIIGDLLGALLFNLIGAGYFAATGLPPKSYKVFP